MSKGIVSGMLGFVVGFVTLGLVAFVAGPGVMIVEDDSRFGFDQTVETIRDSAIEAGWKVPTVHRIDEAVSQYGYQVPRVAVLELCQPQHAARILADGDAKVVTSLMPCRVSVYETADGRVVVSRMNTGLLARMFGGVVTEVMTEATQENEEILAAVIGR
ncbi:DUF302 domain-containing protein [Thioalkalicoccus limnaeus]|uniref:DUF302 domain-containing protein n=1 Tax=Thioalkalicoccus limnaeus TaxID=120681 RepID=A0ABV4BAS0_9GAMM